MSDPARVCIVDDDESFRGALTSLVELLGYQVDAFASAEAFLASELVDQASCVIADIQMPGMSGIELHRRLLAADRLIPFIFVTAFPDDATLARALREGAVGYLNKPMHEAGLVECLARAVERL